MTYDWVELVWEEGEYRVTCEVSADAARASGYGDIIQWSALEQQRMADKLGACLLTPKLSDLIHLHADVRIEPVTQVPPGSGNITAEATSAAYSDWVNRRLIEAMNKAGLREFDGLERVPLVSGTCKDWVLDRVSTTGTLATNHGWHTEEAPHKSPVAPWHLKCWQAAGHRHNAFHRDPSQGGRWVQNSMMIERKTPGGSFYTTVQEVLIEKELAHLLSHQGPLPRARLWVRDARGYV